MSYNQNQPCVCALGFFDGVHKAHAALLKKAREKADELGIPLTVFTFSSLPTKDKAKARLLTQAEREELLLSLGVDRIYTVDFSDVCNMSAREFVQEILVGRLDTRVAFSGEDFKFGKGGVTDASELRALMRELGRDALTIKEVSIDGRKISSSDIKALIAKGDVKGASTLLSRPYFVSGTVEHGRRVGRRLGYPTLNTAFSEGKLIPKRGVYKSSVYCDGKAYRAITNVGTCPTFDERELHAESFLLDECGELYGREVKVYFLDFIRDEMKFESADTLSRQITEDVNKIKDTFSETEI